ncbi:MAG TPA: hypothetical protein PKM88_08710 [bacterium]|nr:hypothetical protein [bacterium]
MGRKRLGEILIELGYLTSEQLDDAMLEQQRQGEAAPLIGNILRAKGYVNTAKLNRAMQCELRQVIDEDATDRFTRQIARLAHDHISRCPHGLSHEGFIAIVNRMDYCKQRIDNLLASQERLRHMQQLPPIVEQLSRNEASIADFRAKLADLYNDICSYQPDAESGPPALPCAP